MKSKFQNKKESRNFYSSNKEWLNNFNSDNSYSLIYFNINDSFFCDLLSNFKITQNFLLVRYFESYLKENSLTNSILKTKNGNTFYFFEYENSTFFIYKQHFYFLKNEKKNNELNKDFKYNMLLNFLHYCFKNKENLIEHHIIKKVLDKNYSAFLIYYNSRKF